MTSKKELLTTVEKQREQLSKYEVKLKDVVRAYKGLLKEKDALEASLTALTPTDASKSKDAPKESKKESESSQSSKQPENKAGEEAKSCEADEDLQKKVAALSGALATLSSEKKRIESSLQNDKKKLLSDRDKLEKSLQETLDSKRELEASSESKIQDLRSRLIVAQHERDQDSQNAAVMLREVESKLAIERSGRERAETLLDNAKQQVHRQPITPTSHFTQYEKKISQLQNELEQVRSRLKRAEQQAEEPPLLRKLQTQMEEMRSHHTEAIQQERTRAGVVEEGARGLARAQEERVATLEARLAELSLTVASYHRTHQDNLNSIHTLKEKVSELAEEKTSLLSRLETEKDSGSGSDISTLCHRLVSLREQLVKANLNTEHPIDVEGLLFGGENIHARCQQEYDNLKEEFENYKISSNQQAKSIGESMCKGECNKTVEELRHKIRILTSDAQAATDSHSQQVAALKQEMANLRETHDNQIRRIESEHRVTVAALEQQLSQQQQRSLATLSERDQEIQRFTEQLHQAKKTPPQTGVGSLEATAALLSQVSGGGEGPLLHHLEELARRDQEIGQLLREKRQLETTMHEVQMAAIVRQQAQQDTIEALQEESERQRRNVSREGENLEYLKNVVLKYMMSSDAESRQLMLNAIAAVLKFTSREVESVRRYNALWWWQPAPRQATPGKSGT